METQRVVGRASWVVGRVGRVSVWLVAGVVLVVACATEPPTSEDLAAALVVAGDLEGEWTVDLGPDDAAEPLSGVVTDEQRALLPSIDLCEAAPDEARAAVDRLEWKAFRQLNRAVDDPVNPPIDREGHVVFVQEFLLSGSASDLAADFDVLRDGLDACLGDIPAGEEGPGFVSAVSLSDIGNQRAGYLYEIGEAGGSGTWHVYSIFVRKGDVLLSMTVADVVLGDLEPIIDQPLVDEMVRVAVDKL